MVAILFSKLGQITLRQAFLAITILCKFGEASFNIQTLEHVYDFQTTGYGGHLVFSK